ncbi:glycosyltransferase family 4 protein [Streptomyces sp. L7]|uniref:glycosyltransferase family 4 protein n=1 Tax=Streptomyces sp. L7 TaxID=3423954 RepID=UPI0016033EA7
MTNVAAPYRRPVWDALAESTELTVLLLENQARFRRGGTNRGREWAEYDAPTYEVAELPTARVSRGESSYYTALRVGFLARYRPDAVLLAGWESPAYWQALIWCKLRGVRTVGFYESTLSTQRHRRGPIAATRRRFFKLLDRVVVPGIAARDAVLAMGVDATRIDVGFNAVDVEGIAERAQAARTVSPRSPDSAGHRFLYVGQLIARKNVRGLIEAFARIASPDDSLTIAGLGDQENALHTDAERLNVAQRIQFTGHIPYSEIAGLFARHNTLTLASTEEVWGLVANEALAAGLHVVISRTAGVAASVADMPGVHIVDTSVESLAGGMQASKDAWNGPISDPPILAMTPRSFATVFEQALRVSDRSISADGTKY